VGHGELALYDSYELAAVRRLLDGRLLAAGAGVLPLPDETPAGAEPGVGSKRVVVAARARRKVTLRALFRVVTTWAARPAPALVWCIVRVVPRSSRRMCRRMANFDRHR